MVNLEVVSINGHVWFSHDIVAIERVMIKSGIVVFGASLLQKITIDWAGPYTIGHFKTLSPLLKFHPKVKPVTNGPYYISFERQILKERISGLRYLYVLYFQPYLRKSQPDKILQFDIVDANTQADWKFPLIETNGEFLAFNQVKLSNFALKTQLT